MSLLDGLDRHIDRVPFLNRYYARRAAGLKRSFCLLLHRCGLLRPFTFVEWLATYECNFHCPYCEASAGKPRPDELTTEEARGLVDNLRRMGARRLLISGGEPLMRRDLVEILDYASRGGLHLGLVTNGFRVEELWPALQRFHYFLYFTSIDGPAADNDRLRGQVGAFERALRGLELAGRHGVPMRIVNTVVHPGNIDQLPALLEVVKGSGATRWHLSPVASVGRAAHREAYALDGEQLRGLLRFIRRSQGAMAVDLGESHTYLWLLDGGPVGKPFFCGAGLTRCSVMPNGDVIGCQQVYDSRLAEGNIRDKPFSRLWREGFQRFRTRRHPETCRGCAQLPACQGGCWAEMERQHACLKVAWEQDRCN